MDPVWTNRRKTRSAAELWLRSRGSATRRSPCRQPEPKPDRASCPAAIRTALWDPLARSGLELMGTNPGRRSSWWCCSPSLCCRRRRRRRRRRFGSRKSGFLHAGRQETRLPQTTRRGRASGGSVSTWTRRVGPRFCSPGPPWIPG